MQVTIDQAGRIIVPKAVRDYFGLRKNSKLKLEKTPDGIVLKPLQEESFWRRENGRLVFYGHAVGDVDWEHLVEQDRDARMRKIGGW
jgi:AbrB family looped-hinge helix DNA binding protein